MGCRLPPPSTVPIGSDKWTVRYYFQVRTPEKGKYVRAARVPSKKEIRLSLNDEHNNPLTQEEIVTAFQKAILPYVVEAEKKKHSSCD